MILEARRFEGVGGIETGRFGLQMEIPQSSLFEHIASAALHNGRSIGDYRIADDARAQRHGEMMVVQWRLRSLTAGADLYVFFIGAHL